jgi:hypothetical protein
MKKILVTLFLFCSFAVQSQVIFTQGYLVIDSTISVFANAYYKFNIVDSLLYLPTGLVKVDSVRTVNRSKPDEKPELELIMFLQDKNVATYNVDKVYGQVLAILYKNGRLVLWTNKMNEFGINK